MLCVYFKGKGAYLGLYTSDIVHRDRVTEDLCSSGIQDVLSLTVFSIKSNIKGPIHNIQKSYNE